MKRVLSMVFLLCMVLAFAGCSAPAHNYPPYEDPVITSYMDSAQMLIDAYDYEGALKVLEDGLSQIQSDQLSAMKQNVQDLINAAEISAEILSENDTQYRINMFLSNFSETKLYEFPCTDYEMLTFVREHCYYNNYGVTFTKNGMDCIREKHVDDVLYKYFALTLTEANDSNFYYSPDSSVYIPYSGGYYYFDKTDYEYNGYVSVVHTMVQDSYGYYHVKYDVFYVDPNYESEYGELYHLDINQAKEHSHLTYHYSAEAVVQDYTRTNGKVSYQLIKMNLLN